MYLVHCTLTGTSSEGLQSFARGFKSIAEAFFGLKRTFSSWECETLDVWDTLSLSPQEAVAAFGFIHDSEKKGDKEVERRRKVFVKRGLKEIRKNVFRTPNGVIIDMNVTEILWKYPEIWEKMLEIQTKVELEWYKDKEEFGKTVRESFANKPEIKSEDIPLLVANALVDEWNRRFFTALLENSDFFNKFYDNLGSLLVNQLVAFQTYQGVFYERVCRESDKKEEILQELHTNHPIRSHSEFWLRNNLQKGLDGFTRESDDEYVNSHDKKTCAYQNSDVFN